jgi:DNA-damage-inducible protein J
MSKITTVQVRINPDVKKKAQEIFRELDISMSTAISLFLRQVDLHKGLGFLIRIPNELTAETLKKSENKKSLHSVNSINELFQELDSENSIHNPV